MKYLDHFTVAELQCPTSKELFLAPGFGECLDELRVAYDHPMPLTSACRSGAHNEWLKLRGYKASDNSFHLIDNPKYVTGGCCAVDMPRPIGSYLWLLISASTYRGWSIGIARTFVHLDMRTKYTKLPATSWTY